MDYLGKSSFNLELRSSHSLNYLIYLQNIYLNLQSSITDNHKFPYFIHQEKDIEIDDFLNIFRELWNSIVRDYSNEGAVFFDPFLTNDGKTIFKRFFKDNEGGLYLLKYTSESFISWWQNEIGQLAIEHTASQWVQKIFDTVYREIEQTKDATYSSKFIIELTYDNFPLGDIHEGSNFIIIPFKNLLRKEQRNNITKMIISK
jgi:hypothetical protein